jgi:methyl-accepting chemotaxis protein
MSEEVSRVIVSIGEIQNTISEIRELQTGAAAAIGEHASKARKMNRDVYETAATCNGTEGKAGVLDMAKQLAAMAESLDEVCRQGITRRG